MGKAAGGGVRWRGDWRTRRGSATTLGPSHLEPSCNAGPAPGLELCTNGPDRLRDAAASSLRMYVRRKGTRGRTVVARRTAWPASCRGLSGPFTSHSETAAGGLVEACRLAGSDWACFGWDGSLLDQLDRTNANAEPIAQGLCGVPPHPPPSRQRQGAHSGLNGRPWFGNK